MIIENGEHMRRVPILLFMCIEEGERDRVVYLLRLAHEKVFLYYCFIFDSIIL